MTRGNATPTRGPVPVATGHPKVQSRQLERSAIVYVRQSSPQQVLHHRESTDLQYRLVDRAKALKFPALALTDHGNLFGAVDFYTACEKAGVKPILGCELYVAPGSRFERSSQDGGYEGASHCTVLELPTCRRYTSVPVRDTSYCALAPTGSYATSSRTATALPRVSIRPRSNGTANIVAFFV